MNLDWKVVEDFETLLGSVEERKKLTVWEIRRQVKLVFGKNEAYAHEAPDVYMWADRRDLEVLIEYLKSGQLNNDLTNEEIKALLEELRTIHEWLGTYPLIGEHGD